MTHWTIYPGVDNESTTGFQIYTTQDGRDPKTMMLQIADTGTIGLGTPPTDGVRLTVDGAVTATTISGDGGGLTVGGQGLTQTLAGLRTDVEARAPLAGATFRGAVTAPSFSGDGGGLTVGGQGLTQTLADLRRDVEARAPLAGATFRGTVAAPSFSGDGGGLTVGGTTLTQTLADLRRDVEARAPLAGATFRSNVQFNGGALIFAEAGGTPYPDNWIGVMTAAGLFGGRKFLHIGGVTESGTRQIGLWGNTHVEGPLTVNGTFRVNGVPIFDPGHFYSESEQKSLAAGLKNADYHPGCFILLSGQDSNSDPIILVKESNTRVKRFRLYRAGTDDW